MSCHGKTCRPQRAGRWAARLRRTNRKLKVRISWLLFQDPTSIKRKAVREALGSEEGVAAARLSRRLVALQTDVDVPVVRWVKP